MPITVINRLVIKPGKMDEFIELQAKFAAASPPGGLVGGRMYRSVDDLSAVLVSTFRSKSDQAELTQSSEFKDHLRRLAPLVESSSPALFVEAYTTGNFA